MSRGLAVLILAVAAALEAGGDALIRNGMQRNTTVSRTMLFLAGAGMLFLYGWTVNKPPWSFGRLLGVYVVFFFVVAQFISYYFFHQKPSGPIVLGGILIVAGGCVITLLG